MKVIELSQAAGSLAEYAACAQVEPLIFTRDGRPVAILTDAGGMDLESASLSVNPAFHAMLDRSRASLREQGGIPIEELRPLLTNEELA